jgi:hypothetical protein
MSERSGWIIDALFTCGAVGVTGLEPVTSSL